MSDPKRAAIDRRHAISREQNELDMRERMSRRVRLTDGRTVPSKPTVAYWNGVALAKTLGRLEDRVGQLEAMMPYLEDQLKCRS